MTYRLKKIRYKNRDVRILLQNENGPCPLLAAANSLLLQGSTVLPAHAIRNDVASLDDVANMLANHAMVPTPAATAAGTKAEAKEYDTTCSKEQQSSIPSDAMLASESAVLLADDQQKTFHINELMEYIPRFQFGMDVNPRFTDCLGYECTAEVTVFDMLNCGRLVHGWLVDPVHSPAEAAAVGTRTYNELMDRIIAGQEAESRLEKLQIAMDQFKLNYPQLMNDKNTAATDGGGGGGDLLDDTPNSLVAAHAQLAHLVQKQQELQQAATDSHLIQLFLHDSSHQLTVFGLEQLHQTLRDDELCVFFRNNHYATLTKHEQQLYLLVTDLGYANQLEIVWEKLDVVDGDTEFCNADFSYNPVASATTSGSSGPTLTPEQLLAASSQNEADYHLAMHLANHSGDDIGSGALDEEEGQIMAAATEASLREYHGLSANSTTSLPNNSRIEVGIPIDNPVIPSTTAAATSQSSSSEPQQSRMSQEDADRLLALQLANEDSDNFGGSNNTNTNNMDDARSRHLAQQLQQEEDQLAAAARRRQQQPQRPPPRNRPVANQQSSNCVVM